MKLLFILSQYLIPQHLLSRLVGKLAETEVVWLKNLLIQQFIKAFKVDMNEAAEPDYRAYPNFNAFFTRALKDGARPICEGDKTLAHPADGSISQLGRIENGRVFQAKGQDYSIAELIGGEPELAKLFHNGQFATVYLSPRDYHRLHMPIDGTLRSMAYVPGDLFSVNNTTAENVGNLFARNERLVCIFDTAAGPMAMVLVGAMIVAAIETVWAGQVAPLNGQIIRSDYQQLPEAVSLKKGDEMGRFKLGSTVILAFGEDAVAWDEALAHGSETRMGSKMATLR